MPALQSSLICHVHSEIDSHWLIKSAEEIVSDLIRIITDLSLPVCLCARTDTRQVPSVSRAPDGAALKSSSLFSLL